jgi:hypothetical protein
MLRRLDPVAAPVVLVKVHRDRENLSLLFTDSNVQPTFRDPNTPLGGRGNYLVRPIPEPSTAVLLGLGLAGLGAIRRRQAQA